MTQIRLSYIIVFLFLFGCDEPIKNKITFPYKISSETTYITEPLYKDGLPDYSAYMNLKYGKGVVPAQNAGIDFIKLFG